MEKNSQNLSQKKRERYQAFFSSLVNQPINSLFKFDHILKEVEKLFAKISTAI